MFVTLIKSIYIDIYKVYKSQSKMLLSRTIIDISDQSNPTLIRREIFWSVRVRHNNISISVIVVSLQIVAEFWVRNNCVTRIMWGSQSWLKKFMKQHTCFHCWFFQFKHFGLVNFYFHYVTHQYTNIMINQVPGNSNGMMYDYWKGNIS